MTHPISYVAQEHPNGCGFACIAMVTGQSYQAIASQVSPRLLEQGSTHYTLMELLYRYGIPHHFLFHTEQLHHTKRTPWPPPPFAPAHIVQADNHYIVWTGDQVLDPARPKPLGTLKDYPTPRNILGVWPNP